MPGVAETFNTVIDEMTQGTDSKLVNSLHAKNANLTHKNLNNSIDEMENGWNIHLASYDTFTSSAKPSSNGRLSHYTLSSGLFDESHRYVTKHSVGWRIVTNARIRFKLQVTATPGFHSLYDWCHPVMCLFPGAPEDQEDETDGNARCRGTVIRYEECDPCHPDRRPGNSTWCSTRDYPNCKTLDDKEMVRIDTRELVSPDSDTEGECTPCWSRMDWGWASYTQDPGGEIHLTGCVRSVEGW